MKQSWHESRGREESESGVKKKSEIGHFLAKPTPKLSRNGTSLTRKGQHYSAIVHCCRPVITCRCATSLLPARSLPPPKETHQEIPANIAARWCCGWCVGVYTSGNFGGRYLPYFFFFKNKKKHGPGIRSYSPDSDEFSRYIHLSNTPQKLYTGNNYTLAALSALSGGPLCSFLDK